MWTYQISTGNLINSADVLVGLGYSGNGPDLDNPASQQLHGRGPIPEGMWQIGKFFDDPEDKGPVVCYLAPCEGTETYGRFGFMIHGDNAQLNHTASDGCIVLSRTLRLMIRDSCDNLLRVIP